MKKTVVIIGSGRSGRGMLGELYHADGYHLIFADNDQKLVDGLRVQGYYHVKMSNMASGRVQWALVDDFEILHTQSDRAAYLEALCRTELISTALLPDAFDQVIEDLADMVRLRCARDLPGRVLVTLGANYVGLYERFDTGIRALLDQDALAYFQTHVSLVMSIVNRKNLLPGPDEATDDPYLIIGDDKPVLRVEALPELTQCSSLPGFFRPEHNLEAAMVVKIWTGNLVQCSMAFVALAHGITGSYEASYHPLASKYAYYAAAEGYCAVAQKYGLPPRTPEQQKQPVTVFRTKALDDSLFRIVREPIRKLGKNDRLIGPALCAARQGIVPYYICRCTAYAFLYKNDADPQAVRLQQLVRQDGIAKTIRSVTGLAPAITEENLVYSLILNAYRDICGADPLES